MDLQLLSVAFVLLLSYCVPVTHDSAPILSTCHFIPIVGMEEAYINWFMVMHRQHPILELP